MTEDLAKAVDGLRALVLAGEQLRNAIATHYAIGASETLTLSHLQLQDGLSPHELAERVGLTPSTITSVLDRLEKVDFVRRSPHPTDRRRTIITLTHTGKELLNRSDEWLSAAITRLGPDTAPTAAAALGHLANSLWQQAGEVHNLPPARHAPPVQPPPP